jgi:glycosyltransferase involved in cell wall biosynthesis
MLDLVIVIPSHNEYYSLADFIPKIRKSFGSNFQLLLLVVDDASTDETPSLVNNFHNYDFQIKILRNPRNLGHGQTLFKGLIDATTMECDYILTLDGDGQFFESEISQVVTEFISNKSFDILELCRIGRSDYWYRRFITKSLRFLIYFLTGSNTLDANTPMRCYNTNVLKKLLPLLPKFCLTPNFFITLISRDLGYSIKQIQVFSQDRRGPNTRSVSWGKSTYFLPSTKLIFFCYMALKQFMKFTYLRFINK